jgi:hypothetical protein
MGDEFSKTRSETDHSGKRTIAKTTYDIKWLGDLDGKPTSPKRQQSLESPAGTGLPWCTDMV